MTLSSTLRDLSEVIIWTRRKSLDEEAGIISDHLRHPLARCHNELDDGAPGPWRFTEIYAENAVHRFHYPADIQEVVTVLHARYPEQPITIRQLLPVLMEVQAAFEDEALPLPAPVGTRVVIVPDGKDYHGAGHQCRKCNAKGHSYEYRIIDVSHWSHIEAEIPDALLDDLSLDDPLYVEYAPSEGAAEANCALICNQRGWIIVG